MRHPSETNTSGSSGNGANPRMSRGDASVWRTSTQLLRQLKGSRQHPRWTVFYRRYAPLILSFARKCGCCYDQAEDVLQETMIRLMRSLPTFEYDPGKGHFRNYLLKIVRNYVYSHCAKQKRQLTIECENALTEKALAEDWDLAWRRHMMARALEKVKTRVSSITYDSFVLYALKNRPADQVARQLNIKKNTVYQHRNRLIKLLSEEVDRIQCESEFF